jgi:hypothetical protein
MTNDDLLIDVLRAAGHEDAASLAEKLLARPATPPDPPTPPAQPLRALSPEEAQREAEGQFLLAALKRDLPGVFDDAA